MPESACSCKVYKMDVATLCKRSSPAQLPVRVLTLAEGVLDMARPLRGDQREEEGLGQGLRKARLSGSSHAAATPLSAARGDDIGPPPRGLGQEAPAR